MNDFENISNISSSEEEKILNNRYRLDKKIGEGSYGIVYRAFDTKNKNNLVAIKQVSKARINCNAYLIEALQKELSIMRLISDENSVKLIEDFETTEHYNLVMELCDSDLDAELKKRLLLNKRGFNELEVLAIMNQFNKVFYKIQKEHVIHRDLKLKNIMIKKDKNVDIIGFIIKLSDFGFSKVVNEDDVTGTNLGSPATKAPEIMIGKDYNAKVDLWSVGVIMFQLFYNRLPFQARNAKELQEVIFSSNGVKLPKGNNNPMSDICFNLIDKLLQKEPSKRIDFDKYFNNEFFSKKHEFDLRNNLCEIKEVQNKEGENLKKDEEEKENNNNNSNINKKNENKNENSINKNIYNDNDKVDFEQRFIKLIKIKEYNLGYIIYKAKDTLYDKIVTIKEISREIIDKSERNKKIFDKEIRLLSTLKGKKFPEFIGLFKTNLYYNIVIEYFSGNNLHNFIKRRQCLDESLVILILKQLKPSLIELNEENIFLDFISPKNFAFTFYINDTNFEIKFFDYGLGSIFYKEKYVKQYLLEEAKLGEVNDSSINIRDMGLTVCKMLFGEEPLIKKSGDNDVKVIIKGQFKGEYWEDLKKFLNRCIKKEKRYNWEDFFMDDFLNYNLVDQKTFINLDKKREPLIKDEHIEKLLEIIRKKLDYIINYFDKLLHDREHLSSSEIYNDLLNDVFSLLLICSLESKTIKKFLMIGAPKIKSKIDKTNQDISLFKIYLNKSTKDESKYYYSYINFIDDNKGNNQYLYNKENPIFKIYFKIFDEIIKKIEILINIMKDHKITAPNSNETSYKTNISNQESPSPDNSELVISNERSSSDNNDIGNVNDRMFQDGNFNELFMYFFENGVKCYHSEEKEKAIAELNMAKYIVEYFIFIKVILGSKDPTINFEKIWVEEDGKNNKNDSDYVIFGTFLGRMIGLLKEKGFIDNDSSTDNLNIYDEPKIENIKIYNGLINFYPRILQFIEEIKNN